MDSPETTAKTNTEASSSFSATTAAATTTTTISSSSSPVVQESPYTNYVSNLSPIETVKPSHGLQGTLELNSPPLVFTTPHTNAPRETIFLKRLPFHQLSSPEMSQNDSGGRKFADGPGDLEKSDLSLHGGLATDTRKDNDMRSSLQVQPSSSSGCVDEYLTDPVDVDCASSAYGVNINLKQSSAILQSSVSGRNDSKKTLSKFDDKNDTETKVGVTVDILGEAEENIHGKSTCGIKTNKNEKDTTYGVWPSNEFPKIESNLSFDHTSKKQQSENSSAQNAGSAPVGESDSHQQLLPEMWQTLQTSEDSQENTGVIPHRPCDNSRHDSEASKQQRGMSRRCLQFAEAQPKATVDSYNHSKKSNNAIDSRSPANLVESESLASSYVDSNAASGQKQLANLAQTVAPMFPPCHAGKSPLTISKPSGIGLHLNSIVNALPKGQGATVGVKLASVEHEMLENKASVSTGSFISESLDDPVSLNWLPQVDHNATPITKRNFNSEQIDSFEEFSQLSPKKKRKKSSSFDGDGCKRCNCKKTRCLKLYCDCFAAGIYCDEPCACQGCFNRPEYEDTVLETRLQIESRNPLAFAPKIIKRIAEFQDDGTHFTPSSARHKRGCNCKKSMCLKKYCECYQANVGCSSGCRCEGCKNAYGKKEEYAGNEELISNRAISEGVSDAKLEIVTTKRNFLNAEFYDLNNLTPPTPSFQSSDHGKDASKSRILPSRYVPSPESDPTILSSYGKSLRPLTNSESNEMFQETSKEILDVDSCGQGGDYNSTDMVEQLSSTCHALADLSDFPPVRDFPSMAMVSSDSSKATDWTTVSKLQLHPRSGNLSLGGSLRWRSSPITPTTWLQSLQTLDSDSRLSGIMEDDTHKILKDASTLIKSVKVSSLSPKRVSPPHSHPNELGSSSSGALKSGRKFILRAVPSFPPLTPCIDSKGSPDRERSNFQGNKQ